VSLRGPRLISGGRGNLVKSGIASPYELGSNDGITNYETIYFTYVRRLVSDIFLWGSGLMMNIRSGITSRPTVDITVWKDL